MTDATGLVGVRSEIRDERARRVDTWTRWSMPVGAAFVLSGTVLVLWY